MTPRCFPFLFIYLFFLFIMSSPTTLMATSRNILPLEPTTLTNDALSFVQRSSRHLATTTTPTSRRSNSLKLSKGRHEQTSTKTHSTLQSCKPKGPIRWSSPSPLRNNLKC
ncbi:hypothetical protein Csa_012277 [Cucumis sativus]|uniref:Uncharacterized protein n=1 Tax=Cucumis sativus TaxID=3659 RepID=A0A0A0L2F6_CUCSA|nr:hypothetical protein Csa_012277 [Cucumis sativus]